MDAITYRKVDVDGINIFYREAGPKEARNDPPVARLSHRRPHVPRSYPATRRPVSPRRSRPPAFGQSDMPARGAFVYTFENIANVIDRFTEVIGLSRFAMYVFDYGAPVGLPPRRSASGSHHRNHLPERQRL